jgi:serine/threonine protein kinase
MPLTAGTRLGPYEIVAAIGAGGMGEVYKAHDARLGRDVALKILPEAFARDPDRLARFRREAQVLASLNHPNIAQIYGIEESNRTLAIVMELVPGHTLDAIIQANGPGPMAKGTASSEPSGRWPLAFGLPELVSVATQIAVALEAAHEKGIVHRDLKPANINRPRESKGFR